MNNQPSVPSAARTTLQETLGPLAIAAALGWALAVSWGKWPDVLIDFGKDIYFAWQITEGAVLYRDLAHFLGPLSPYLNALWFEAFGVSLETVFLANLTAFAALLLIIYALLRYLAGPVSATVAVMVFVLAGAFTHVVAIGGYNFMAPNTHENTHSLLLAFVALACFAVRLHRGQRRALVAAGLAIGLAVLTRPAPAAAAGLAIGIGMLLAAWCEPGGWRRLPADIGIIATGVVVPVLIAVSLFALAMPVPEAIRGVLSPWFVALDSGLRGLPTHRAGMGLDRLHEQLQGIMLSAAVIVLYFVGLFWLAWRIAPPVRYRRACAVFIFVMLCGLFGWSLQSPSGVIAWVEAAQPLQLMMLAILVGLLIALARSRRYGKPQARLVLAVTLTVFALASLAKIIVNVRIYQYGYILTTPAVLVLVVALTHWLPGLLRRLKGWGELFAAGALAALVIWVVAVQTVSLNQYRQEVHVVATAPNWFLADRRGEFVAAALQDLKARALPGQTLAVLPEGAMMNFLAKRRNPTPFTNLMPVEFKLFGEAAIVRAYSENPPDFIVLAHKDTSEYGYQFFATDYAKPFAAWLAQHYRVVRIYGAEPLKSSRFGLALLELR